MRLKALLTALMLSALLVLPASAYDMTISGADQADFARATSDDTFYVTESNNQNLSKDTAVVPPNMGYTASATVGTLLNPYAATWDVTSTVSGTAVSTTTYATTTYSTSTSPVFTSVSSWMYDANGSLGTLTIPSIGLSVPIYEGTDSDSLALGAGHFETTSIWSGNVCLAGHNRGVTNHFGLIHTLTTGNTITLETAMGSRTYAVTSVEKVLETNTSMLSATSGNQITLVTCVMDESEYRWVVTAVEV
ncbi:class D sortase [Bengtsoniella intestinalis]|uniref:class D sortase n=1 Tax=Bengtsoniella intestinalis TaxID=3073143 RepID=UPI00391EEE98